LDGLVTNKLRVLELAPELNFLKNSTGFPHTDFLELVVSTKTTNKRELLKLLKLQKLFDDMFNKCVTEHKESFSPCAF
jgi:hypothetical protein